MRAHHLSPRKKVSRQLEAPQRDLREAKVQQALEEWTLGQHRSIRAAAKAHGVAYTTLYDSAHGKLPKKEAQSHLQALLPPGAEMALRQHIERCSIGGFPLTTSLIHQLAESVLRPLLPEETSSSSTLR